MKRARESMAMGDGRKAEPPFVYPICECGHAFTAHGPVWRGRVVCSGDAGACECHEYTMAAE